jgi:predicted phosphodiesterase
MNRIVLFSDVHGNITGLKNIMLEVAKLENVTHIIGAGDYFGYGAGCNDVIELCQSHNAILIRGGHEEIYNIIDNDPAEHDRYYKEIYDTHLWLKKNLNPEFYKYITTLPLTYNLQINKNYNMIVCHASKDNPEINVCASDQPLHVLENVYGGYEENIIVYGHYHENHVIPIKNKLLINCASVGMRKSDNLSKFTIIEYDNEKVSIIQKSVTFDVELENLLLRERGAPRRK